jgi:hypothetical protein
MNLFKVIKFLKQYPSQVAISETRDFVCIKYHKETDAFAVIDKSDSKKDGLTKCYTRFSVEDIFDKWNVDVEAIKNYKLSDMKPGQRFKLRQDDPVIYKRLGNYNITNAQFLIMDEKTFVTESRSDGPVYLVKD